MDGDFPVDVWVSSCYLGARVTDVSAITENLWRWAQQRASPSLQSASEVLKSFVGRIGLGMPDTRV